MSTKIKNSNNGGMKKLSKEEIEDLNKDEIKELQNELKKYQKEYKLYKRIQAVLMVKLGETRAQAAKYVDVHRNTVGAWVKNYDESGLDGLKADYSKCGAESKLTTEQLNELYEMIIDPEAHYTIKDVKKLIKDKYEVDYSMKQVWIITRIKFGLNYKKPYLIYKEAPENADKIFKKKHRK